LIGLPQLILASASLPLIGYGAFLIYHGDKIDGLYGIVGGIYTFMAVILIPYGFPGYIIFPGAMMISSLGGFHTYRITRSKGKIIKGISLLGITIIILILQMVL
jgi:hypothetical protein